MRFTLLAFMVACATPALAAADAPTDTAAMERADRFDDAFRASCAGETLTPEQVAILDAPRGPVEDMVQWVGGCPYWDEQFTASGLTMGAFLAERRDAVVQDMGRQGQLLVVIKPAA